MIPNQLQFLANHLWQSTLFAVVAGLLSLVLRKNRAQTRYWLWFTASVKFLIPLSILVNLGSRLGWKTVPAIAPSSLSFVVGQASQTLTAPVPILTMPTRPEHWSVNVIPIILCGIWTVGLVTLVVSWWIRWRRLRDEVRGASRLDLSVDIEVRTSPAFSEPGLFGVRRPVLLLPAGITDHLTALQLKAILTHELCHVYRRDNLGAAIHLAVEALFWFHPLVWWLGARLMEERERACDEEVLLLGTEPEDYAAGILKVCEVCLDSAVPCLVGLTGANLKQRVEDIMTRRIAKDLDLAMKLLLIATGLGAVTAPLAVGMLEPQVVRAQPAQAEALPVPKWEVASVKPCSTFGPGDRGATSNLSPGRMTLNCYVVESLITSAFLQFAKGVDARDPSLILAPPIEGGPGWIASERYTIDAKAEGPASAGLMQGPMLQALLEDRFNLKTHWEDRQGAVYALTVAKAGSKLKPFVDGSCITRPRPQLLGGPPTPAPPLQPGQSYCMRQNKLTGVNMVIDAQAITIDEFLKGYLGGSPLAGLDRPVVDKTGLTGRYNIHLEYAPPANLIAFRQRNGAEELGEPTAPSIATALQEQLGLKLEPVKGNRQILVIDHIERPAAN